MSNLLLRVLSAVVLLPGVIALCLWRETIGLALLALVAAGVALGELGTMWLPTSRGAERALAVLAGLGFGAWLYLAPAQGLPALIATGLLLAAGQVLLCRELAAAGARAAGALAGIVYVVPLLVALPLLHRDAPDGARWVLLALGVTFSCDTGAYFVGRALGRHKLAPAISPGKTWEGVVGGVAAALAFVWIARATFFPALEPRDVLSVGLGASVLAPLGDLFESLLKRAAGVKDSGRLIPGHGGVLDRVDALLFVGGFLYVYVTQVR